jgi:hypothetical protein
MRRLLVLVLVLALGLIAAACGGGGEDASALSDAIADAMMDNAGDDAPIERGQAECFGDEIVETMGAERLVAVGLSVEDIEDGADPGSVDLNDDDIDKMTNAITECIDFGRLVVDEMTAEIELSADSADCLADGINEADFIRAIAESSFFDEALPAEIDNDMNATLFGLLGDCLTADELTGFLGG